MDRNGKLLDLGLHGPSFSVESVEDKPSKADYAQLETAFVFYQAELVFERL